MHDSGVVVISEDMPSLDLDKISLLKRILPTSQLVRGQPRNVLLHRFQLICMQWMRSITT